MTARRNTMPTARLKTRSHARAGEGRWLVTRSTRTWPPTRNVWAAPPKTTRSRRKGPISSTKSWGRSRKYRMSTSKEISTARTRTATPASSPAALEAFAITRRTGSGGWLCSEAHDARQLARALHHQGAQTLLVGGEALARAPDHEPGQELAPPIEDGGGNAGGALGDLVHRDRDSRRANLLDGAPQGRARDRRLGREGPELGRAQVLLTAGGREVGEQELADGRAVERTAKAEGRRVADGIAAVHLVDVDGHGLIAGHGGEERRLPALLGEVFQKGTRQLGQLAVGEGGHGQGEGGRPQLIAPVGGSHQVAQPRGEPREGGAIPAPRQGFQDLEGPAEGPGSRVPAARTRLSWARFPGDRGYSHL